MLLSLINTLLNSFIKLKNNGFNLMKFALFTLINLVIIMIKMLYSLVKLFNIHAKIIFSNSNIFLASK